MPLEGADWPEAESGAFVTFGRDSGVPLIDAVAASCAIPRVWPAVSIGGQRYYDGGLRSGTNADLALGYGRVVVFDVLSAPETADVEPVTGLAHLRIVTPGEAARAALADLMDPNARKAAAEAGYRQGQEAAAGLAAFWRG